MKKLNKKTASISHTIEAYVSCSSCGSCSCSECPGACTCDGFIINTNIAYVGSTGYDSGSNTNNAVNNKTAAK